MSFNKLLSNKAVLVFLILLIIFLGRMKYRQYLETKKIEAEKSLLEGQAQTLEKKNQELNDSLKYLSSLSSKERVARQQLNLKKPGEIVYGFTENNNPGQTQTTENKNIKTRNLKKWWQYFMDN